MPTPASEISSPAWWATDRVEVQASSAFGILLILAGLAGLAFGTYALLRGGRGQQGKIGPIPERGVHLIAGARMFLVGALCLAGGTYLLLS
jgi:hypothetical protein